MLRSLRSLSRMAQASDVLHDVPGRVFYIPLADGHKAVLEYSLAKGELEIVHTGTPPSHRGKGIAQVLTNAAFHFAQQEKRQIVATCSYAAKFAKEMASDEQRSIVKGLQHL